jgi:hypothetical protein
VPIPKEIPLFTKGEAITTGNLNPIVDTVNALRNASPGVFNALVKGLQSIIVKITVDGDGGALYMGRTAKLKDSLNTAGGVFSWTDIFDFGATDNCIIIDVPEEGDTTHRIAQETVINGFFLPIPNDLGLPVVIVNFGRKSWKVRWNDQTKSLEQSSNWEDDNPTWEVIVTFAPCEPDPPAVTAAIGGGFVPAFSITAPISSTRTLAGYLAR